VGIRAAVPVVFEIAPDRNGRHYRLTFSPEAGGTPMNGSDLEVTEVDFRRSFAGPDVALHSKRGWLGLSWYESIEFHRTEPMK
jgi:hypothetical protein